MVHPQKIRLLYKSENDLGEGACYDREKNTVHWVDIPAGKLCHLNDMKTYSETKLDIHPGFIALYGAGGLVVGGDQVIQRLDIIGRVVSELSLSCKSDNVSVNDGSVHPSGKALFFGTKHNLETDTEGEGYIATSTLQAIEQRFTVFNGPAFSPDGTKVYFTDSPSREIWRADFNLDKGTISNQRLFAKVPEKKGYPDGMAVDCEGCLWSAHWDGACVTRYNLDGTIHETYEMPVTRPTSLAFSGKDLKTIVVTSAALDEPSVFTAADMIQDGDLFAFDVDVAGQPVSSYRGNLI